MAKLRPYSCPKCGSFLEVDRDQDYYDCPFCGSHFDAVTFHGKDLLEQAGEYMRRNEFQHAREKYEFLLSKNPENFEYLYGYACAVGCVSSIDKYEDPKSYSKKLETLFGGDPRYSSGPCGPYFQKLYEMNNLDRKHSELLTKQKTMESQVLKELGKIDKEREYNSDAFAIYIIIHVITGLILCATLINVLGPGLYIYLVVAPFIVYFVTNVIHKSIQKKLNPRYDALIMPLLERKKAADEMMDDVKALSEAYDKAFKDLQSLKPAESAPVIPIAKLSAPYKRDHTRSITQKLAKTAVCNKCGAELKLDREKKLYICSHCGVSYDYSLFVGDDKTKANAYLKNREFELADKRFAQILEADPSDYIANRGRILCAGKWIGFAQVKLNEDLMFVDWKALNLALDAAIKNTDGFDREYFNELKKLTDLIYEFNDVNLKIDKGDYRSDFDGLRKSRNEITDKFPQIYKNFISIDRRYMTAKQNDYSYWPGSEIAYRLRILEKGRWNSINEINPAKPFGIGVLAQVKNAVKEAKSNTPDKYSEYFTLWGTFVDMLGDYAAFRMEHKELSGEDSVFASSLSINPEYTSDWEKNRSTIQANEQKDKQMRADIDAVHKKLIEMDNRLFFMKKHS